MTAYIIGKTNYKQGDSTAWYYRAKHLLEILKDGPKTTLEIIDEIGFEHSIKAILKTLYSDGLITMIRKDRKFPYALTDEGKEFLSYLLV